MTNQINIWKKREKRMDESAWLAEGIDLYRELLSENPYQIEFKNELAKLLIRSGTDEKMKFVNLIYAEQLFNEVLEIFPENLDALYRLGHIHFENRNYERSIDFFKKALEQRLSEIRVFRIFFTMSKANHYLVDEGNALLYFKKAKESDPERNFLSELNELEQMLKNDGRNKLVAHYPDEIVILVSYADSERLKDDTVTGEDPVLDLTHFHPTYFGPEGHVRLERKEAELLKYLIKNRHFIQKEQLLNLWEEDEKPVPETIKSYISKIRKKLIQCFPEKNSSFIENKRGQGYRWTGAPTIILEK
jgi:tetratricopeptide (TPR) repeat protein